MGLDDLDFRVCSAVVPVKPVLESKSRLSSLLEPGERGLLSLTMLRDVVQTLSWSQAFSEVAVISSDPRVHGLAGELGVKAIHEHGHGLNRAVDQATRWFTIKGAEALLVLPSDIPLLTIEDLNRLLVLGGEKCSMVLAPSHDGGTNALLRRPPGIIPPCFGSASFMKHLSAAEAEDVKAEVYRSHSIALDIDTADDLELLLNEPKETHTHRLLEELKINKRLSCAPSSKQA